MEFKHFDGLKIISKLEFNFLGNLYKMEGIIKYNKI
jgi:hypothetical protein